MDEAILIIHLKKFKIGIPEIGIFSVITKGIVNLKLKFRGYNENKMVFHLTSKIEKYYFRLNPGG